MFRTSVVHLQERSYAVCCNLVCLDTLWGWRKNCSSSFTLITTGRIETYQIATYSIRTLLKMDYWSPKHVVLLNVMNKINHQILCILLDYRYIAKWYTVRTISKKLNMLSLYDVHTGKVTLHLHSLHIFRALDLSCTGLILSSAGFV